MLYTRLPAELSKDPSLSNKHLVSIGCSVTRKRRLGDLTYGRSFEDRRYFARAGQCMLPSPQSERAVADWAAVCIKSVYSRLPSRPRALRLDASAVKPLVGKTTPRIAQVGRPSDPNEQQMTRGNHGSHHAT